MAIMISTTSEARAYGKAGARAADQAGQTALAHMMLWPAKHACSKFRTKDRKSGDYLMGGPKRHPLGLLK
jgi:hypothetical protein